MNITLHSIRCRALGFFASLLMAIALLFAFPLVASAAVDTVFNSHITIGGEQIPCTFKVLTEDETSGTGTVQVGIGDFTVDNHTGIPLYSATPAIPKTSIASIDLPGGLSEGARMLMGSGELVIPATVVDGGSNITYTVTAIGDGAFAFACGITAISLPDTITSIGKGAFFGNTGLASISLPSSVKSLDSYAFSRCTGAAAITGAEGLENIGESAFEECVALTQIALPASLTQVSYRAFARMYSLREISFPAALTNLGNGVLQDCYALNKVTFPTSSFDLGEDFFYGDKNLTTIVNASSIRSVGEYAFCGCMSLEDIPIPAGATTIAEGAYASTGVKSLTIPARITSIDAEAFSFCEQLRTVTFEEGSQLTTIGENAFERCSAIGSIDLPSSVNTIGAEAFSSCYSLASFSFPSGVSAASNSVLNGCWALESVTFPSSFESLGLSLFSSSAINSITVPSSVTNIDASTFRYSTSLAAVILDGSSVKTMDGYWDTESCADSFDHGVAFIYVPDELLDDYKNAAGWEDAAEKGYIKPISEKPTDTRRYALLKADGELVACDSSGVVYEDARAYTYFEPVEPNTIPEPFPKKEAINKVFFAPGITEIGSYTFAGAGALTSVTIPASVQSIGDGAFEDCVALRSISFTAGTSQLTSVGMHAFSHCFSLEEADFLSSLVSIGRGAFNECSSLQSVTLPANLVEVPSWCFAHCTELSSVTLPTDTESLLIGEYAFYYCSALENITLPDQMYQIQEYAFSCAGLRTLEITDCSSMLRDAFSGNEYLQSVEYGAISTSLPDNLFAGCIALNSVTFDPDVTFEMIGNGAFANCDSLTSFEIPDTVTAIGDDAFGGCNALTSITIPSSVGTLYGAFSDCMALTSLTIPDSVTYLNGSGLCSGCRALSFVTLPAGADKVPADAFKGCWALPSITIPDSYESISDSAFMECYALSQATLPASLDYIGFQAFALCPSLETIDIPSKVRFLGDKGFDANVFAYCTSLSSIDLPSSLETIGKGSFAQCAALEEITIPAKVSYVGATAFCDCISLKTLIWENDCSTTTFMNEDDYADAADFWTFYGCSALDTVVYRSKKPVVEVSYPDAPVDLTTYYQVTYYPTEEAALAKNDPIGFVTVKEGTNISSSVPAAAIFDGEYKAPLAMEPGATLTALDNSCWALTSWKGVVINNQPIDTLVATGTSATLSVSASILDNGEVVQPANLSYQWYKATAKDGSGGQAISGAVSSSYTTSSLLGDGLHYYYCVVSTDTAGLDRNTAQSNVATLTVSGASIEVSTTRIDWKTYPDTYPDGSMATSVTVKNTGTAALELPLPVLTGEFRIVDVTMFPMTLEPEQSKTFMIRPLTHDVGEYEGSCTISSPLIESKTIDLHVAFESTNTAMVGFVDNANNMVPPASNIIDFGEIQEGYDSAKLSEIDVPIGIKNIASTKLRVSTTALTNFDFSWGTYKDINGLSGQFYDTRSSTLKPKIGLEPGTYEETLTFTATTETGAPVDVDPVVFTVKVEVVAAPASMAISTSSLDFGSLAEGYITAPVAQSVTVNNTGGAPLDLTFALDNADFTASKSSYTLAAKQSTTVSVQPVMGLSQGTHTATLTIDSDKTDAQTVTLNFEVLAGDWLKRLGGSTRYDTMSLIATAAFGPHETDTVIVATATDFPDALAASGLAGIYNAPVLLTDSRTLSAQVVDQITRIGASRVIIVGGPGVVSPAVAEDFGAIDGVTTVSRYSGDNRYMTSIEIYHAGGGDPTPGGAGRGANWSSTAIIAWGGGYADALSVAPYAYASKSPIFLCSSDGTAPLSAETVTAIKAGGFTNILIVGGTGVVPETIRTQLDGEGFTFLRLSGENRYSTSSDIANWATGNFADAPFAPIVTMTYENFAVATGTSFPDALAGSVLCGKKNSVLLLAGDVGVGLHCINNNLEQARAEISHGYIFGGTGVVSAEPLERLIREACGKS